MIETDHVKAERLEPLLIELFHEHYASRPPGLAKKLARTQAAGLLLFMRGARDEALKRRAELYDLSMAACVSRQDVHAADARAFRELVH